MLDFAKKIAYKIAKRRTDKIFSHIVDFLRSGDRILDIGAGNCIIAETLVGKGLNVTPLEIQNKSLVDSICPVLYNGVKIPFQDDKFDTALIVAVLHHSNDPVEIIKEAKRIAKRIIIVEDVYTSSFHKYLTYFIDSLVTLHIFNHPHSNKDNQSWQSLFDKLGLKLEGTREYNIFLFLKNIVYCLEK